jgi:hypothetical protein
MTKQEAVDNFQKRGWIEIKPEGERDNFYLVKNNMVKVPNRELMKLTQAEIGKLQGLAAEEADLLIYAKKLYKGKLL